MTQVDRMYIPSEMFRKKSGKMKKKVKNNSKKDTDCWQLTKEAFSLNNN